MANNMLSTVSTYISRVQGSMSISDILGLFRRTLSVYIANISTITKIALSVFIPAQIVTAIAVKCLPGFRDVFSEIWEEFKNRNNDSYEPVSIEYRAEFFFFLIVYYLGYLLYSFATIAMIKVASDTQAGGEDTTFMGAIGAAMACYPQVFLAGCLVVDVSTLGTFLFIIPGIFLATSFWLAKPVIVIEGTGIFLGMKRSWEIASGFRWDLLKILAMYLLSYFLIFYVFHLLLVLASAPNFLRLMLGLSIPIICVQPIVCILQTVVYFDLTERHEHDILAEEPLMSLDEAGEMM